MNPKEYAEFLKTLPPETAEAVKACMRAGMDAAEVFGDGEQCTAENYKKYREFRKFSDSGL